MRRLRALAWLLCVAPMWAATVRAQAPAQVTTAAERASIAELQHVLANPTDKRCPDAELDRYLGDPYRRASRLIAKGSTNALLRILHIRLKFLRQDKGCLHECPEGSTAGCELPTCDQLWADFTQIQGALAKSPEVTASDLQDAFTNTFVELIRVCPRDDRRVADAIGNAVLLVTVDRMIARLIVLVGTPQVSSEQIVHLVEAIGKTSEPTAIANALTRMAEALAKRTDRAAASDKAVVGMLGAVWQLLRRNLSEGGMQGATALLDKLRNDPSVQQTLGALEVLDHLRTPEKQRALAYAIDTLLARSPELKAKVDADLAKQSHTFEEVALKVVRLINDAELRALRADLAQAERFAVVPVSRLRERLLVVERLAPCSASPIDDAGCAVAQAMGFEFLRTVYGRSLHGASYATVPGSADQVVASAKQVLGHEVECTDAVRDRYGDLCAGGEPYRGVLVLQVTAQTGADAKPGHLVGSVNWCVRDQNATLAGCSLQPDAIPRSRPVSEAEAAAREGFRLAGEVLRVSGSGVPDNLVECKACQPADCPKRSWPGWLNATVLGVGIVGVTTGVYLNNTAPEAASGDWAWRGGLGLLVTALALEVISEL